MCKIIIIINSKNKINSIFMNISTAQCGGVGYFKGEHDCEWSVNI